MISTPVIREAARDLYEYLIAHPELHNQAEYGRKTSCGTTMCVAGHIVMRHEPESVEWNVDRYSPGREFLTANFERIDDIDAVAGKYLGLESDSETYALFYEMSNSRALEKLRKISTGEGWTLEDFDVGEDSDEENLTD